MKKCLLMVAVIAASINAFAAVALSNVKVKQRYPWNGKVDISFKFDSTRSNNVVRITAIDRSTGKRLNVVNLLDEKGTQLFAPIKKAPGEHRIVWDADKDLEAGFRTDSVAVSVSVGKYFEYPTYCAIDISGGPDAVSWPVTYFNDMPEGGWPIEYKTTKLLFKLIQPGSFMMGPGPGHGGNVIYENQHHVTLTKPFYINVFELSNKQWSLVQTNATFYTLPGTTSLGVYGSSSSQAEGDLHYRHHVLYDELRGREKGQNWPNLEVDDYSVIGRMRQKSGIAFLDLPSEAQWEYACRAGTTTAFNNGTEDGTDVLQWGEIGSARPNAWGLYDFHLGAYEWCGDFFLQQLPDAVDPMIGREAWDYHPIRGHYSSNWRYFDRGRVFSTEWSERCGARFVIFLEHNQE